jgi:hypothetical protein
MDKDRVAAGHAEGAEVGGEGGFGEHGKDSDIGYSIFDIRNLGVSGGILSERADMLRAIMI